MVQDILNDLESDEVNSIDDTVEATQVAQIIKTCYFEMMSNRDWPHLKRLMALAHSADPERPTHLILPEQIKELTYFAYESARNLPIGLNIDSNAATEVEYDMRQVKYLFPDAFLRLCSNRNKNTPNVRTVTDFGGTRLVIGTDSPPSFWTSFDDKYLVCDSFDSQRDDALQAHKTQAMAVIIPQWRPMDEFVPDLPVDAFAALLAEAKSTAFFTIKQMMNDKAEQKAVRQQRWLSRKAGRAHNGVRYANYGRRSAK